MSRLKQGVNDLQTRYPDLAKEWNSMKNGLLTPNDVTCGSNKVVWWICEKGHDWQDSINHRISGRGCPYCSHHRLDIHNSLAYRFPELAVEWDYSNNTGTPKDYAAFSNKLANWICTKCNHHWQTTIANRTKLRSGCPVCANQTIIPGINDLASQNPFLAAEWDYEKNTKLPTEVGAGSLEKVWWKCAYGHSWESRISHRNKGIGCPVCAQYNKTSSQEYAVYYYVHKYFPDAIHSYRSPELERKEIDIYIPSSHIGIEYDGQMWHKDINRDIKKDSLCAAAGITLIRIRESECNNYSRNDPIIHLQDHSMASLEKGIQSLLAILHCSDKINLADDYETIIGKYHFLAIKNNFLEKYPNLAAEWHPTRNGALLPENTPGKASKLVVFWRCAKCGHEWKASLDTRIRGTGCPVCAGRVVKPGYNDLLTLNPNLAAEWHPTNNDGLLPSMVTSGSGKNVWWKCKKGHEWKAAICDRKRGNGCPYCSGKKVVIGETDLLTVNPLLASEWHPSKNKDLLPSQVSANSGKTVWWKCKKGHEWKAKIYSRNNGCGCPECYKLKKK